MEKLKIRPALVISWHVALFAQAFYDWACAACFAYPLCMPPLAFAMFHRQTGTGKHTDVPVLNAVFATKQARSRQTLNFLEGEGVAMRKEELPNNSTTGIGTSLPC